MHSWFFMKWSYCSRSIAWEKHQSLSYCAGQPLQVYSDSLWLRVGKSFASVICIPLKFARAYLWYLVYLLATSLLYESTTGGQSTTICASKFDIILEQRQWILPLVCEKYWRPQSGFGYLSNHPSGNLRDFYIFRCQISAVRNDPTAGTWQEKIRKYLSDFHSGIQPSRRSGYGIILLGNAISLYSCILVFDTLYFIWHSINLTQSD